MLSFVLFAFLKPLGNISWAKKIIACLLLLFTERREEALGGGVGVVVDGRVSFQSVGVYLL